MEQEKKATFTVTIDPNVDEVIVIKAGQVFRAKTSDGNAPCGRCELPCRGRRQCNWSMVCSNVTNGAIFRRYVTAAEKRAADEAKASRMEAEYKKRWNGD